MVNWDTADFSLENMEVRDLDLSALCQPLRPGHVLFPLGRNFTAALDVCRKMRANMTVVHDRETQTRLNKIYRDSPFVEWTGRKQSQKTKKSKQS